MSLTILLLGVGPLTVVFVALVKGAEVALDGQLAVHIGVLRAQVWLVEVIHVLHVGASQSCKHNAHSDTSRLG